MIDERPGDIFRQGQILNNTYEIEGVLGRGGTGEVYRARNLISGRIVAIKALNQQFSGNDDYIGLMRREEQMRDVMHDAVVRYTECSRSDQGHVFLVMDFVDGPSVADVMATRRPDPRELLIIAHRIAEGLVAAHGHGIVHRDLSPDNVILKGGNPERATIIDFGIAKDTTAGARTIVGNDFAGKYEYAAPEQLEGRAEPRSDLYALGALILAAWRCEVPFAGATPGEMVRRKQQPLDTSGVPEPLKGVIEWLSAPDAAKRPTKAADVVTRLDQLLRPQAGGRQTGGRQAGAGSDRSEPRRGRQGWLWLVAGVSGAIVAAYLGGAFDALIPQPPPLASPFRLTAAAATDGQPHLSGNAPDAESAVLIRRAYGTAAGTMPPDDALTLATGAPFPTWPDAAASGFAAVTGIEDWTFDLADKSAAVTGLAPDRAARDTITAALSQWATSAGLALTLNLDTGPRILPATIIAKAIAALGDCGPLQQSAAPDASYTLGDTITITGDTATAETATTITTALTPLIGDRRLSVAPRVLNPAICKVRALLPHVAANGVSVWLGNAKTGTESLTGVFHVGEFPAVDIRAPDTMQGQSLWVGIADVSGNVLNILPNVFAEEDALDRLGTVEGGLRRIKVMPVEYEANGKKQLFALQIDTTNFGASEIIAITSRTPLFDIRRPKDESVASFAQAIDAYLAANPDGITAIATRLLDSRP